MPIGEIIIVSIGEIIGYIIFELIIRGIGRLLREIYYWIRKLLTGKEREIPELKRIEKHYLFKKFKLKTDFDKRIPKGTSGIVMEVIDEHNLFVEFEDSLGKPILVVDKQVFKIKRRKIILKRIKRKHSKV
jgi:hypothetical protein